MKNITYIKIQDLNIWTHFPERKFQKNLILFQTISVVWLQKSFNVHKYIVYKNNNIIDYTWIY